jgi:hypothetical protein
MLYLETGIVGRCNKSAKNDFYNFSNFWPIATSTMRWTGADRQVRTAQGDSTASHSGRPASMETLSRAECEPPDRVVVVHRTPGEIEQTDRQVTHAESGERSA